jgi:hypothetical protein
MSYLQGGGGGSSDRHGGVCACGDGLVMAILSSIAFHGKNLWNFGTCVARTHRWLRVVKFSHGTNWGMGKNQKTEESLDSWAGGCMWLLYPQGPRPLRSVGPLRTPRQNVAFT